MFLATLNALLVNTSLIVSIAYALSLTYSSWRPEERWKPRLLRTGFAAVASLLMMYNGFFFEAGLHLDASMVPVLLISLRYGPVYGLLVALPVTVVQVLFYGVFPWLAALKLSVFFVAVWLILRPLQGRLVLTRTYRTAPLWVFLAVGLVQLLGPDPLLYLERIFLWHYLMNVVAFWGSASIFRSRMAYLKATETLHRQTLTDPLTGLLNRRQFVLDQESFHVGDVLLTLDLDHFKKINDLHGHHQGDLVLKGFAEILRRATREYDRLYRLGGEEFLVVLRNIQWDAAVKLSERIRETVEHHDFGLSRPVTVSGGMVVLEDPTSVQQQLQRADELLYTAKFGGRNTIIREHL